MSAYVLKGTITKGGIKVYSVIDYEDIADKYHHELLSIYVTDTLKHSDKSKWENLSIAERQKLVDWVCRFYINDETNLNIGCICDVVMEHSKEMLGGKMSYPDISHAIYTRWL